jgi:NADH:quinone reductase (non-electrogenic)
MNASTRRVVIVGGGFGGVRYAKTLRRRLPSQDWEIVLFNRENHMVFHPHRASARLRLRARW